MHPRAAQGGRRPQDWTQGGGDTGQAAPEQGQSVGLAAGWAPRLGSQRGQTWGPRAPRALEGVKTRPPVAAVPG